MLLLNNICTFSRMLPSANHIHTKFGFGALERICNLDEINDKIWRESRSRMGNCNQNVHLSGSRIQAKKKSLKPRKECTSPMNHMLMIGYSAWSDDMVLEGSREALFIQWSMSLTYIDQIYNSFRVNIYFLRDWHWELLMCVTTNSSTQWEAYLCTLNAD